MATGGVSDLGTGWQLYAIDLKSADVGKAVVHICENEKRSVRRGRSGIKIKLAEIVAQCLAALFPSLSTIEGEKDFQSFRFYTDEDVLGIVGINADSLDTAAGPVVAGHKKMVRVISDHAFLNA